MPGIIQDFRVFIASPGGLSEERSAFRDLLREFNELDPHGRRVIFTPIGWEETLGGFGRPQELINADLVRCDYFVLVLWDRWGSPPDTRGRYSSGCEEEFALAGACLEDPLMPMRQIVVFFKDMDVRQKADPGDQLKRVLDFRSELERSKKHLFMTFSEISSFQNYLRRFLARWGNEVETEPSGHVEIIDRGVKAWNSWRKSNPKIVPVLASANLRGMYLNEIDLHGVDLRRADLSEATLIGANLREADLSNVNMSDTNMYGCDLIGADLSGCILNRTHISEAKLNRSILDKTVFSSVDLGTVSGLEEVDHRGPSEIGIDTLYKSKANVPEIFLRGCGVSEQFIAYARSLFTQGIEFYSCFISYSHADKAFVRRLHDGLQGRGVRCWLDEHQLLPGHNIYEEVDRGIRLWDKVILCCSESSLTSWWVDSELDSAFNKEQRLLKERGGSVRALIPLDLDGYLFQWESGKASTLKERMAADFSGWEHDNVKFEAQFERLVKALRTDEGREIPPKPRL